MKEMVRRSTVTNKNPREILLLKGRPCIWGKCAFCDYILDNETDEEKMVSVNRSLIQKVTGEYGALEAINSGSVFELPEKTWADLLYAVREKNIRQLFFESYWSYRERLSEVRAYFGIPIIMKCGIETFDNTFRNQVLKKGFVIEDAAEAARCFESVCLLVGVCGQTKDMIKRDIDLLLTHFKYGCVNVFINNSTSIKADPALCAWFYEEFRFLEEHPTIEVLWNNTDFGVGGFLDD